MKTKFFFFILFLICCTAAFGQEVVMEVVAKVQPQEFVFGGVWTLTEAKSISGNLWGTFFVGGVFSIPLIATWEGDIPTVLRALFWIPAAVGIIALILALIMWFGIIFSTTAAAM